MNEVLMRVVVEVAAFFELWDDDVLDPRLALKQLESIGAHLRQLDPAAKTALIEFTQREAARVVDPQYRAFLLEFPDAVGLSEAD